MKGSSETNGLSNAQVNSDLYLYWAETWNKAIAESWRDPDFAAQLVADPQKALLERFGFVFRENIDLTVVAVDAGSKDADGKPYGWTSGAEGPEGWNLPATGVKLYLPPRPEANEQAVAVMAYWETGESLPFTTGCC